MVNVAGLALVAAPYPDCAIIGPGHELLACRGELDVHNGRHMALVDVLGLFEVSGVEYIDVVIYWELVVSLTFWGIEPTLGCHSQVHGFHGVKGDAVGGKLENRLDDGHWGESVMFYNGMASNSLPVRRSKRMTDRSVATDPTMDVSTWLKQTSVMVSVWFGHWIL